jgi:hypothetical protein
MKPATVGCKASFKNYQKKQKCYGIISKQPYFSGNWNHLLVGSDLPAFFLPASKIRMEACAFGNKGKRGNDQGCIGVCREGKGRNEKASKR